MSLFSFVRSTSEAGLAVQYCKLLGDKLGPPLAAEKKQTQQQVRYFLLQEVFRIGSSCIELHKKAMPNPDP